MDPPQRFSSNRPYRPLAEAVCQRRLIAAQGWDMITLPQHEWRRNVTQKQRAAYLEKLLDCTLDRAGDSLSRINTDSDVVVSSLGQLSMLLLLRSKLPEGIQLDGPESAETTSTPMPLHWRQLSNAAFW